MPRHLPVLVVVLAACSMFGGKKPYTPAADQGDVPLRIANHTDQDVCGFIMTPKDSTKLENWLGGSKLAPNAETNFNVKAGAYQAVFTSCDNSHTGTLEDLELDQATLLSYGADSPAKEDAKMGAGDYVCTQPN